MVGIEEVLVVGAAATAIALNNEEKEKIPEGPSSEWTDDWNIHQSYGTLADGSEVVVLVRNRESTLGDASDNLVSNTPYYSAALVTPNNERMSLTIFGGASSLGIWPNSNPDQSLADEAAQNYWNKTGGSGDEGPAGPVGPQNPIPPSRPQLPDSGGVTLGSEISNPADFNIDDLRNAGRYGDTEIVHVNQQEIEMLKKQGGSGSINPKTGLQEFFYEVPDYREFAEYQEAVERGDITPQSFNFDDSIQNQIQAFMDGQPSCFDMAQGQGWQYVAGGKVLVLDDDDNFGAWGIDQSSGTLVLRIAPNYRLNMIIGIDTGVLNIGPDSGVRNIFDEQYIETGNPNLGYFVDARISEEYAIVPMKGGDSIQIDIDGIDGSIGDFRVIATPEFISGRPNTTSFEITDSFAVNNDVQLAIDKGSVKSDSAPATKEENITRRDSPTTPDDDGMEREEEEPKVRITPRERSPLTLALGMAAIAVAAYLVFFSGVGEQVGEMRL